ncbi:MAG: phosphonate ABC transporter, permease protein PhnE [Phycisphaeraceae bacterium]
MSDKPQQVQTAPADATPSAPPVPPAQWTLRKPYGWKTVVALLVIAVFMTVSAQRTQIGQGVIKLFDGLADLVVTAAGVKREPSPMGRGLRSFVERAFPPVISRERPVELLGRDFDRDDLPWFSSIQQVEVGGKTMEVLHEPVGYLMYVLGLIVDTIEIAIWGTLLAMTLAVPLACLGASNFTPNKLTYTLSRGTCNLCRSIPELVSALLFVVMFGTGAFAGVLALGTHCAGFLGKFIADDMENTDRGPQEALASTGAGRLKVIRFAVLPQIMPQVFAYLQYILERNVRTATVLGIVGAGGIGLELIMQWNMYNYGHATTILLVIFATVIVLEHLTQRLRRRII